MTTVAAETFEQLALSDPEGQWELFDGEARRKPGMTANHNQTMNYLGGDLMRQLDRYQFQVRINSGHMQRTTRNYFIPDVAVVPAELVRAYLGHQVLEVYAQPLPLVVEVWSSSTGGYDQRVKLAEYQRRGDAEIWLLHPYDRTLIAWRREAEGTYQEHHQTGGIVAPVALPNVRINLDELFD